MKSASTSSFFPMDSKIPNPFFDLIPALNYQNAAKLSQQPLLEVPFSKKSNQEKIAHRNSLSQNWGEDPHLTKKLKTNQDKENLIVIDSEDEADQPQTMANSIFEGAHNEIDQSLIQRLALENIIRSNLKGAEMALYFSELQRLLFLQQLQATTYKTPSVDFNSLFLSALFDNQQQQQAHNDFALMKQSQNPSEKKSDVVLIEDEEEKCLAESDVFSNNELSCFLPNLSDKAESSNNVNFDALSSNSSHQMRKEKRTKSKSEKNSKIHSSTSAKERAMERWRAVKEYQERMKAEAEKPYVIDLHIDVNSLGSQEIKTVPIGPLYQTAIPALVLNRRNEKEGRKVKAVWIPDEQNVDQYKKYIEMMEQALRRTISNEEKAVKLLIEHGMDIEKLVKNIQRNQVYYRNYFKTDQRTVRSLNL